MTGSATTRAVLEGLDAGATDFLAKPVRLDELVARVRAHLRLQETWTRHAEADLQVRGAVIAALGRLAVSGDPEEAAATVVGEVGRRTGARLAAFLQITGGDHLRPLATFTDHDDVRRRRPDPERTGGRTTSCRGRVTARGSRVGRAEPRTAERVLAGRPGAVAAGAHLRRRRARRCVPAGDPGRAAGDVAGPQARLLAAAIDYAGAPERGRRRGHAGPAPGRGDPREAAAGPFGREYHPVFQPIVELAGRTASASRR